jgi:hypothetical protein
MPVDESKLESSAESGGENTLIRSAADRIEENLAILEEDGPSGFAHAWEDIGRSLNSISHGKDSERIEAVFAQHRQVMDLWNSLNMKIFENNNDASFMDEGDLKKAIQGYRALVADLRGL